MNELLITTHNERVGVDDFVWFLGDVAMGKIAESLPLVAQMHGRKGLIIGNHDRVFKPKPSQAERWYTEYSKYFDMIHTETFIVGSGVGGPLTFKLNHFPYSGDSHGEEDRYQNMRPDHGEEDWLLHGHTHSKDFINAEARQVHCGVDSTVAGYGPLELEFIVQGIEKK